MSRALASETSTNTATAVCTSPTQHLCTHMLDVTVAVRVECCVWLDRCTMARMVLHQLCATGRLVLVQIWDGSCARCCGCAVRHSLSDDRLSDDRQMAGCQMTACQMTDDGKAGHARCCENKIPGHSPTQLSSSQRGSKCSLEALEMGVAEGSVGNGKVVACGMWAKGRVVCGGPGPAMPMPIR